MFISDLMKFKMGAPICFDANSGGASGGGSTVMTGESTGESDGGTGGAEGGDGGSGGTSGTGGAISYGNWRDQVSDDLKGSDFIKGYEGKTLSDLVNEHIELKGKADKFTPLAENATDAERSTWLKERMTDAGHVIPEDVKGYEVGKPEIPEGMYYNEGAVDTFLSKALELGLSKNAVQELVKANDDAAIALHIQDKKDAAKAHNDLVDVMKKEHGDEYKTVVENSYRANKAFGDDELNALMDGTIHDGKRLGDHPAIVRMFNNVAKAIGEDKAGAMMNEGAPGGKQTPTDQYGNPIPDFSASMGDGS